MALDELKIGVCTPNVFWSKCPRYDAYILYTECGMVVSAAAATDQTNNDDAIHEDTVN